MNSMSWPTNVTDLSLAGAIKWLLLIFTIPFWIGAWHGIIEGEVRAYDARSGNYSVYGTEAIRAGVLQLLYAGILIALAWAVWRFWQSNED
jgi:hypothetical protein